jgi:hypothetical protein
LMRDSLSEGIAVRSRRATQLKLAQDEEGG